MSNFSTEQVARIAEMARIAMTEEEIEQLTKELVVITSAVDKVAEVATDDVPATSHPLPLTNVLRADEITKVLDKDAVMEAAPQAENGQFAVPQMLGEEQ